MFCCAVVDMRILADYGEEQAGGSTKGDVVIIIACILLVTLSVFGYLGTVRENEKMLYMVRSCIFDVIISLKYFEMNIITIRKVPISAAQQ